MTQVSVERETEFKKAKKLLDGCIVQYGIEFKAIDRVLKGVQGLAGDEFEKDPRLGKHVQRLVILRNDLAREQGELQDLEDQLEAALPHQDLSPQINEINTLLDKAVKYSNASERVEEQLQDILKHVLEGTSRKTRLHAFFERSNLQGKARRARQKYKGLSEEELYDELQKLSVRIERQYHNAIELLGEHEYLDTVINELTLVVFFNYMAAIATQELESRLRLIAQRVTDTAQGSLDAAAKFLVTFAERLVSFAEDFMELDTEEELGELLERIDADEKGNLSILEAELQTAQETSQFLARWRDSVFEHITVILSHAQETNAGAVASLNFPSLRPLIQPEIDKYPDEKLKSDVLESSREARLENLFDFIERHATIIKYRGAGIQMQGGIISNTKLYQSQEEATKYLRILGGEFVIFLLNLFVLDERVEKILARAIASGLGSKGSSAEMFMDGWRRLPNDMRWIIEDYEKTQSNPNNVIVFENRIFNFITDLRRIKPTALELLDQVGEDGKHTRTVEAPVVDRTPVEVGGPKPLEKFHVEGVTVDLNKEKLREVRAGLKETTARLAQPIPASKYFVRFEEYAREYDRLLRELEALHKRGYNPQVLATQIQRLDAYKAKIEGMISHVQAVFSLSGGARA